MAGATLFDGQTAYDHAVEIALDGDELRIAGGTGEVEHVELEFLSIVDENSDHLTLSRANHHGWRLIIPQPVDQAIRAKLSTPARYGNWIDRFGLAKASVTLGTVAAVVLAIGYTAPKWIAPYVPESWERNLGQALVGDFGDYACHSPRGDRALKHLAKRIGMPPKEVPITMTVLDIGIFNAAALPGGQVVIFKGALDETDNPDAMAGILAHEFAHVRRRHVTQALIRELGIGALVRLFAGGVGAGTEQIVSLSYTRSNEAEADSDAIAALEKANIDPRPTADLFATLDKAAGPTEAVQFLNSHPRTKERAAAFRASYRPERHYAQSLSPAEYQAIRQSCPVSNDGDGQD